MEATSLRIPESGSGRRKAVGKASNTCPGEHVYDRCDRPTIEERASYFVVLVIVAGVVDNAGDKLIPAVESRVSALSQLVEWIERSREGRRKSLRVLSVVPGYGESVTGLELKSLR